MYKINNESNQLLKREAKELLTNQSIMSYTKRNN